MRVMHSFEQMGIALDAEEEAALQEDAAIREIYEWELIAGGEDDEGLANPTDAAPPNAQPFEIRKVVFKTTVLKSLKAIALVLQTSQYGTKQVIFNRRFETCRPFRKFRTTSFIIVIRWRLALTVLLVWRERQHGYSSPPQISLLLRVSTWQPAHQIVFLGRPIRRMLSGGNGRTSSCLNRRRSFVRSLGRSSHRRRGRRTAKNSQFERMVIPPTRAAS